RMPGRVGVVQRRLQDAQVRYLRELLRLPPDLGLAAPQIGLAERGAEVRHALRLEPEERVQRLDAGRREVLRVVEPAVRVVVARADRREEVPDRPVEAFRAAEGEVLEQVGVPALARAGVFLGDV